MNIPKPEDFGCPKCGRKIIRPDGAETSCTCGNQIPKTTQDDRLRRLYSKPIMDALGAPNELTEGFNG